MNKNNYKFIFNQIRFEEIEIGMAAMLSKTIYESDVKNFSELSGDHNPVHLDEECSASSMFKNRIAHGMMISSYFSALFGTKIPGNGCVYTHQSLNFKRPVYINDKIDVFVVVTGIDRKKRRVAFETVCEVGGRVVIDGVAEIYVPVEFKKLLVNKKEQLVLYKKEIFELFYKCFNFDIDEKLWEWAYLDNPNGDPIVSLYFHNNTLVGHYATIPMKFILNSKCIYGVLSMTTMVEPSYRKYGIFVQQANEVYLKASEVGYKFVCGFPNKKSAPGFKKRLGWTLDDNLAMVTCNYNQLKKIDNDLSSNLISYDTEDQMNIDWRLNKPNQVYFKNNGSILKCFNGKMDIIYNNYLFNEFDKLKEYNLLVDYKNFDSFIKKDFDYIFGYRLFDDSLIHSEFKKDLIISDIF